LINFDINIFNFAIDKIKGMDYNNNITGKHEIDASYKNIVPGEIQGLRRRKHQ